MAAIVHGNDGGKELEARPLVPGSGLAVDSSFRESQRHANLRFS